MPMRKPTPSLLGILAKQTHRHKAGNFTIMKQNGVHEASATNPTSSSSSSSDQTGSSSGSSLTPSSGTSATGESYHSSGVTSSSSGSGSSSYTEASSTVSTLPPVTEDEDVDEPDGPPRSKNWGLLLSANERLFDNFG